jgi:molybdopterin-guanine dinucleotide biosynthesis protein A
MAHTGYRDSVLGVVLSGGRSRRFQEADKAFETLAGRTLVERVVERALPQVARLIISANGDLARYGGMGVDDVIIDHHPDREGPLAGVEAAIKWLETKECALPWVATFPVDGPFVPADLVVQLLERAEETGAPAVASSQGKDHPTFGIWPVGIAETLRSYLARKDRESILSFVASVNGASVAFEPRTPDPFFNINTREDLAQAEALIGL